MKLCEFYHCLPSQLAQEDAQTIARHLEMRGIEQRAEMKPVSHLKGF